MKTLPVLFNVLIVLIHTLFVSATDFYWIAAGNTCHKTVGTEHFCIHYSNCLDNKSGGHIEFCYFDNLKPIWCCVQNDESQVNHESGDLQQFPHLDEVFIKSNEIYPWDVSEGVWDKGWDYKSNSAILSGDDFDLPIYDWTKSLFDETIVENGDLPKIHTVYGVPTLPPDGDGLDISSRIRGPDGKELPADLFRARIADDAEGLNIQKPFYKPTIENSTSLRMCNSYFRSKRQAIPVAAVVGGDDARPKEFPHLALLGYGDPDNIQWACGGTLISDQYVLTAAHCISSYRLGDVKYVRLGELDLNSTTDDASVRNFTVTDAITHPLYNFFSDYHDIGLVRLNESITSFNEYIKPACLATTKDLDNVTFTIAGWGRTEVNESPANILQSAALKLVPHERCRSIYRTPRTLRDGIVEDVHICADGGKDRKDACYGDSGGPLQFTNNNFANEGVPSFVEVAGVVSFGHSCGIAPGVYTRVLPYVKWIEDIVWP
ncbi:Trypsin [Popillia japonica]|uniref:Trypsin n=1 Tax=Popillia japonica TaxID=7064 RepID=A0AAW1JG25_POPJA